MPTLDAQYVQIRDEDDLSWHLFATFTRVDGRCRTVCDLNAPDTDIRDELPQGEKSCETCFRRIAK